jgi:aspartate aminotransferase
LFLNSPGNPSGAVYDEASLKALGAVLERHPHVLVLSDEIYEHIIFDGLKFISFAKACPQLKSRSLIVNGMSKAYAMTGWRVGYAAGPLPLIKAMATVQSQSITSVCSIAQAAGAAALEGSQEHIRTFRDAFQNRRDLVVKDINTIEGLSLRVPEGAFYAFINCAGLIGKQCPDGSVLNDDTAVANYLLNEGHVAAVPGAAYGMSPYFRISTATSDEVLGEAIRRIAGAVARLKPASKA